MAQKTSKNSALTAVLVGIAVTFIAAALTSLLLQALLLSVLGANVANALSLLIPVAVGIFVGRYVYTHNRNN